MDHCRSAAAPPDMSPRTGRSGCSRARRSSVELSRLRRLRASATLVTFMPPEPSEPQTLDLTTLKDQCKLSRGACLELEEAASVMLTVHGQASPSEGTWEHITTTSDIFIVWATPDDAMMRTHNNSKDATEDGAYAVAVSAAFKLGFEVQGRTDQGSGADYWMIRRGGDPRVVFHMEVSGIGKGGSPGHRLTGKTLQGKGGSMLNPGVAVVFRFSDVSLRSREWKADPC